MARRWIIAVGIASLLVGLAMLGYVGIAIYEGSIQLASRSSDVLVSYAISPLAFAIGVFIYGLGGVFMSWAGLKMIRR